MSFIKEIEYRVVETFDEQGQLLRRNWYEPSSSLAHRIGGPAAQGFDPVSGKLTSEVWVNQNRHGKHRDNNLPSEISIDPKTDVVFIEQYYERGRLHRDDGGPVEIYRDNRTGHIVTLIYRDGGFLHRDGDHAAIQEFDPETGHLVREEYYFDNELHRADGPAVIEFDQSGKIITGSLEFYHEGKIYTPTSQVDPLEP